MLYQAVQAGMGSRREVETNYSFEEICKWLMLALYDGYTERKQYEK